MQQIDWRWFRLFISKRHAWKGRRSSLPQTCCHRWTRHQSHRPLWNHPPARSREWVSCSPEWRASKTWDMVQADSMQHLKKEKRNLCNKGSNCEQARKTNWPNKNQVVDAWGKRHRLNKTIKAVRSMRVYTEIDSATTWLRQHSENYLPDTWNLGSHGGRWSPCSEAACQTCQCPSHLRSAGNSILMSPKLQLPLLDCRLRTTKSVCLPFWKKKHETKILKGRAMTWKIMKTVLVICMHSRKLHTETQKAGKYKFGLLPEHPPCKHWEWDPYRYKERESSRLSLELGRQRAAKLSKQLGQKYALYVVHCEGSQ